MQSISNRKKFTNHQTNVRIKFNQKYKCIQRSNRNLLTIKRGTDVSITVFIIENRRIL